MFNATPAKLLRKQALSETLAEVGQTIASALTPEAPPAPEADIPVEQVFVIFKLFLFYIAHPKNILPFGQAPQAQLYR